jgi:hypothetical protein
LFTFVMFQQPIDGYFFRSRTVNTFGLKRLLNCCVSINGFECHFIELCWMDLFGGQLPNFFFWKDQKFDSLNIFGSLECTVTDHEQKWETIKNWRLR